jgi:hypothetical protein
VSASGQIINWSTASPYYSGTGFDTVTGNYTVPASGKYSIHATVNYQTAAAISINLGPDIDPSFVVRRTSPTPTSTSLITGFLPVLDVNIALVLYLRTILAQGTVTLSGEVYLTAGDVIGLFYNADGLTIPLNVGGNSSEGVVWSVHQLSAPIN